MGQAPSSDALQLETRVEDPQDGQPPRGLALMAHGRLGGTFDQPPVRRLAEYLRDRRGLRVVTWNARGMGNSEGGNEWTSLSWSVWTGEAGVNDYTRMLKEAMAQFVEDFPESRDIPLFLCGYSAGAIFAGCNRPPPNYTQFSPAHYILVSYPVELNLPIGLFKTSSYFRSVEALVQGYGWENLPAEFNGKEPEVSGVFTISGQYEQAVFYARWRRNLESKDVRHVLTQAVVEGAGHAWGDKSPCIVDEVDKWLQTLSQAPGEVQEQEPETGNQASGNDIESQS